MTKGAELDKTSIRDLRIIVHAAKSLNFAATAEAFGVARTNVLRIVSNYEEALGVTLFNRSTSGTRLTPLGKEHAEDLHFTLLYFDTKCAKLNAAPATKASN